MCRLRLIYPAGAHLPLHPREIRRLAQCMLQTMTPRNTDVELVFVRDSDMADLNQRFMDCQGPTNCLAFPSAGHGGGFPGGGLCISLDALYRESLFYDQADALYLCRLLAHGLAHLAGHDHGAEMDTLCAALEECREEME